MPCTGGAPLLVCCCWCTVYGVPRTWDESDRSSYRSCLGSGTTCSAVASPVPEAAARKLAEGAPDEAEAIRSSSSLALTCREE